MKIFNILSHKIKLLHVSPYTRRQNSGSHKQDNYVQLMKKAVTCYSNKGKPFEINVDEDYLFLIVMLFVFFLFFNSIEMNFPVFQLLFPQNIQAMLIGD